MTAYSQLGQGAVVMTNSANGSALSVEIMRSIAHVYNWPDLRPEEKVVADVDSLIYNSYTGKYQVGNTEYVFTVSQKNGDLYITIPPDGLTYIYYPESETKYFALETEFEIIFEVDPDGQVNSIKIPNVQGVNYIAQRIE